MARSVIWLFLCLTNAISFSLVRQMELDADQVEVALAGDSDGLDPGLEFVPCGGTASGRTSVWGAFFPVFPDEPLSDEPELPSELFPEEFPLPELPPVVPPVPDPTDCRTSIVTVTTELASAPSVNR